MDPRNISDDEREMSGSAYRIAGIVAISLLLHAVL